MFYLINGKYMPMAPSFHPAHTLTSHWLLLALVFLNWNGVIYVSNCQKAKLILKIGNYRSWIGSSISKDIWNYFNTCKQLASYTCRYGLCHPSRFCFIDLKVFIRTPHYQKTLNFFFVLRESLVLDCEGRKSFWCVVYLLTLSGG